MAIFPADSAVLGTLYGSDAMRKIFDERAWFQNMLDVEAALARVQARLGIIPADAAEAIGRAARYENLDTAELAASVRNVGYPVVGVVKGLSRAAGAAGAWTHWGATTQDIMDSATALQMREGLALLRRDLVAMIGGLAGQADAHRRTVMAGRTHLQHALPVTFGLKCAVWLQPLVAHVERIDQLLPRAAIVQFGGAAGTLASLGEQGIAVLSGLAAELRLGEPPAPWHVSRDGFAEAVGFCGLLCGSLAKIATDVILMAQTEVGELAEPYVAGRGSSSTMPQKRNPIASEYVLARPAPCRRWCRSCSAPWRSDHERATGPWQAELLAIPQAFVLTHGALQHAATIAEGMVVDAARMRKNLDSTGGLIVAEAVMMGLAPHARARGRAPCRQARLRRGLGERHSTLADALLDDAGVAAKLDRAAIERMTDPERYLGSSGAFIDRVLEQARRVS